jgi:hypothetical protein
MAEDSKQQSNAAMGDVKPVRTYGPMKHAGQPKQGEKRNPGGRPPGSVNRMTREMREAVLGAAEELGHIPYKHWKQEISKQIEPADDGVKQFYKVLAVKELRTFGSILARMMPSKMTHSGKVTAAAKGPTYSTYEEVIEGLREAGLPLDLIDKMHGTDPNTLTIEEYGSSPYGDPEADEDSMIDVTPPKEEPEP